MYGPAFRKALADALPEILLSSEKARAALGEFLKTPETRKILDSAIAASSDDLLKNVLERRFAKVETKIEKKISDASSSIMATLKGGIEGKVLAALTSATHSKEFRDLLQEITIFSAQHALKDSAGPLFERLREDFRSNLGETLDKSLADIEGRIERIVAERIRGFTGHLDFDAALSSAVNKVFDEASGPRIEKLASELRAEFQAAAAAEARRAEGRIVEISKAVGDLASGFEELRASAESVEAADAGFSRISAAVEDLRERIDILREKMESVEADADAVRKESEERVDRLNAAMSGLDENISRIAKEVLGEGEGGMDRRMKKAASEVVNLNWESRVLPQIAELAKKAEEAGQRVLKEVITNDIFVEKVRIISSEERRESRREIEEVVDAYLKKSGISEEGIPRDLIEAKVAESISASLKDAKALTKRLEPLIKERMDELSRERGAGPNPEEIRTLIETEMEKKAADRLSVGAETEKRIEELKNEVRLLVKTTVREFASKELSDTLAKVANSPDVRKVLKDAVSGELVETAILEKAVQSYLATDDVKEMIDDRFRTIRMFLKNEEIPRIVKQIIEEGKAKSAE